MITWTSKGLAAVFGVMALTACEAGPGLKLSLEDSSASENTRPLSRASMANGVVLVAPSGYCVDQASLEARFAVMARCDSLGAKSAAGAAPRGLITVSLTNKKPGPLPSARQVALASKLQNVRDVEEGSDLVVFRAQGRIPVGGLSPTQWRGMARIGSQTAGIAIYGPEHGEMITITGRAILRQLVDRSVEATPKAPKPIAKRN